MCGIAGIASANPREEISPEELRWMSNGIIHRGPDGEGAFRAPGIALAHRRLAIIDLAGGSQPLGNEDGSIQVVFNGEIYNYRELRQDLERKGHRFATNSDTETLVHLYEEKGDALVEDLRGMFAFALWDGRQKRLLLARDRLGIKPLYYRFDKHRLLFASELKAILAVEHDRTLDVSALESYLAFGMVTGSQSIIRGIEKLPPGHTLAISASDWRPRIHCYWRLQFQPDAQLSEAEWCSAIRNKLEESVDRHLIADVPVGAFLSGGFDSSVITALAAQRTGQPVQTFSIGFREAEFNELPYARQVAGHWKTQHVEEVVSPDAVALLDDLCWYYDEPFADASAIPTMLVSQLAARHVKVVLSGDGGDEAFGGYARYAHDLRESAVRAYLPQWLRRSVLSRLAHYWPKTDWLPRKLRAKTALTNLSLDPHQAYGNTLTRCRLPLRRQLLAAGIVEQLNGNQPEALTYGGFRDGNHDPLASMISADIATLLPDDYLVKVDRASMAYGLEVRPPLLDHELFELASRIPSRFKVRQGETKWIFKQACGDLLPQGLLNRPKQGFDIPLDAWFRGPLKELFCDTVLQPNSIAADYLELPAVRRLFERHQSGGQRNGQTLWALLVFSKWADTFLRPSHTGRAAARVA
ncbi:asparagine synthase (glutamine-hydrolyzing) [Anatilimnocola sp. NA78]|uniref:asparagine synthase (glutamine-hydrolyzing) n=1 Tax=Anatilimnocola sp. NA78 TaxID=3415683 RepID=UPI003CE45433